jgi:hypothetical protein
MKKIVFVLFSALGFILAGEFSSGDLALAGCVAACVPSCATAGSAGCFANSTCSASSPRNTTLPVTLCNDSACNSCQTLHTLAFTDMAGTSQKVLPESPAKYSCTSTCKRSTSCCVGTCGTVPDGCGGNITCGACAANEVCSGNTCTCPNTTCSNGCCNAAQTVCDTSTGNCCNPTLSCTPSACGTKAGTDNCGYACNWATIVPCACSLAYTQTPCVDDSANRWAGGNPHGSCAAAWAGKSCITQRISQWTQCGGGNVSAISDACGGCGTACDGVACGVNYNMKAACGTMGARNFSTNTTSTNC